MMDDLSDERISKTERRWKAVQNYLQQHDSVQNADICRLLDISPATANRLLRVWTEENKLERYRSGKTLMYRTPNHCVTQK